MTVLSEAALLEVVDPSDPRLAQYRDLKDPVLRRLNEGREAVFVVEGKLALEAALSSPYPVVSVLVLRKRLACLDGLALPGGVAVYVASDQVMAAVSGFNVHRGLLAIAKRLTPTLAEVLLAPELGSPLVVVEAVSDQENLGAIFRNAAAFGASAVLLGPTCADPLYRRSVRVSLGAVLKLPFARLEPWPGALSLVTRAGFVPLALTPRAEAEDVSSVAAELQGQKVALLVGAEGTGLSAAVMTACRQVRVPMAAGVDSLNVAAATAVALHRFTCLG